MRLRIAIGLAMIFGGFLMKAALNHNIGYWGQVKTWTVVLPIFGLTLVGLSLFVKVDSTKPDRFIDSPLKWIINRSIVIVIVVLAVGMVIKMEDFAVLANQKLRNYHLSRETETTMATVVGQIRIPYSIKFKRSYQEFAVIRYSVGKETMEQGIEGRKLIAGRELRIKYSKLHPSFFRID